jgi:hypothetical protein
MAFIRQLNCPLKNRDILKRVLATPPFSVAREMSAELNRIPPQRGIVDTQHPIHFSWLKKSVFFHRSTTCGRIHVFVIDHTKARFGFFLVLETSLHVAARFLVSLHVFMTDRTKNRFKPFST